MNTILRRNEIDIAIRERAPSGGISTDTNRGEALESRESIKELAISDIRMKVANVEGSRRGMNRRLRNCRHCEKEIAQTPEIDRNTNHRNRSLSSATSSNNQKIKNHSPNLNAGDGFL